MTALARAPASVVGQRPACRTSSSSVVIEAIGARGCDNSEATFTRRGKNWMRSQIDGFSRRFFPIFTCAILYTISRRTGATSGGQAVKSMKLYLEGPGRERRPVKVVSTERKSFRTMLDVPGRRAVAAGLGRMVEVNTLMDEEGNLAQQIDSEGFRYRFSGSELPWSLIVG